MSTLFAARRLCIATMHGKERVIAPHVERLLGVNCFVAPPGFDSDRFGTFSGEVPRVGTPLDAARQKAAAAMDASGVDLAIASEGSFVPHPEVGLIQVGVELVVLFDRANGLEICGEDLTTETNHARRQCAKLEDVLDFGGRVGFPAHGLVLMLGDPPQRVRKGLRDHLSLAAAVQATVAESRASGQVWFAQSDMRADQNPTRMRAIDRAAAALAVRAATPCPACGVPGFGQIEVVRGLPCAVCDEPTRWLRAVVHGCARCSCRREVPRADGLVAADPGNCPVCNP